MACCCTSNFLVCLLKEEPYLTPNLPVIPTFLVLLVLAVSSVQWGEGQDFFGKGGLCFQHLESRTVQGILSSLHKSKLFLCHLSLVICLLSWCLVSFLLISPLHTCLLGVSRKENISLIFCAGNAGAGARKFFTSQRAPTTLTIKQRGTCALGLAPALLLQPCP